MDEYHLDLLENGERVARAGDDLIFPNDLIEAGPEGLLGIHRCQHCGLIGGH